MGRFAFIGRRLVHTTFLLLGITLLVFLLLQVTPGDPARAVAGPRASEAELEQVRDRLGLNDSVASQYIDYLGRVVQGDLGTSTKGPTEVSEIIARRLPVTLWLIGAGTLLSLLIAMPLGILAALHRDRFADHAVRGLSLLGLGMPVFWIGYMLLILIALPTGWFPVGGFGQTLPDRLRSVTLPGLTLAIVLAPIMIRSLRSSLIGVLESDYVACARSVGVRGGRLMRHHVLRNAITPMIVLLAVQIGFLLFGVVIIEQTFALPGLGEAMLTAAAGRDFPVVQGITLVLALMVTGVHLVADIVTALLDPRVRIG